MRNGDTEILDDEVVETLNKSAEPLPLKKRSFSLQGGYLKTFLLVVVFSFFLFQSFHLFQESKSIQDASFGVQKTDVYSYRPVSFSDIDFSMVEEEAN